MNHPDELIYDEVGEQAKNRYYTDCSQKEADKLPDTLPDSPGAHLDPRLCSGEASGGRFLQELTLKAGTHS